MPFYLAERVFTFDVSVDEIRFDLQIFQAVQENKPFIMNAYHALSREQIENYLFMLTHNLLMGVVEEKSKGLEVTEEEKSFIADFYKYGFVGLVLEWIDKGMKEDPKKIIERLNALIQGSFAHALNNAKLNKS